MFFGIFSQMTFEFSAGGLVFDAVLKKVLLVQVKNLQDHVVWTFPKGHIEKGETAEQAALREVREETGWSCLIQAPLHKVQYWFRRDGSLVKKTVTWFLMAPKERLGAHDPKEIMDLCWASGPEAQRLVSYRSDVELLNRFVKAAK